MAEGSVPGALAHESPVFGLAESHATMNDAAGFLEQLAALFEEIGRDVAENSDERHLAALGAYYAREHTHMLRSDPGNMVDCAAFMKEASECFDRLERLFQAIHEKAEKFTRARALAGVGWYTASDFANTLGVARERAEEAGTAEAARSGSKPGGRAAGRKVEDPAQGEIDPVDPAPRIEVARKGDFTAGAGEHLSCAEALSQLVATGDVGFDDFGDETQGWLRHLLHSEVARAKSAQEAKYT